MAGFRAGLVAVSPGLGSIVGTGGTSGSKPKGRTRSRVELFTFPEQLPGPARFGKGFAQLRYAEKIREAIRRKLRVAWTKSASRYIEEMAEMTRHRREADNDVVAAALRYVENPNLLAADFRKLIHDDFPRVFYKRRRLVRWRFWELYGGTGEEWQISDGADRYRGWFVMFYFGRVYKATGLHFTDEQVKYSFRLERFTVAATLAKSRAPEHFRAVDTDGLGEFRQACLDIRHGKREWSAEPDVKRLEMTIAALEMRIRFENALGDGETEGDRTAVESLPQLDSLSEETPVDTTTPAVSVNALMLDIMQSVGNEECLGWSVEDWREKMFERFGRKPAKSTIHKQPTWDLIRTLRIQAGDTAHEHQTAKDETGRRRSRIT